MSSGCTSRQSSSDRCLSEVEVAFAIEVRLQFITSKGNGMRLPLESCLTSRWNDSNGQTSGN